MSLSHGSGERRGDLVRGVRTLTGTVERTDRCVILRVDRSAWALLGAPATKLAAGRTVEVTGTVATPPPGCVAHQALMVTRVR